MVSPSKIAKKSRLKEFAKICLGLVISGMQVIIVFHFKI